MLKIFKIIFVLLLLTSCKKSTLIEQVDVPATPIQAVTIEGGSSKVSQVVAKEGVLKMFVLPFEYKDLEPHLDATTVEIHYSKHHLHYVNTLNTLIIGKKYEIMTLADMIKNLNISDVDIRNNAGGIYNHNFFWENLKNNGSELPESALLTAIIRDFGSFDEFKLQFTAIANQSFGSGWCWLISDKYGKLRIAFTPNNDNPLIKGTNYSGIPLLTIDLWEHAYYLKFQNKKREYINTFYNVVNWEKVSQKYDAIPNKGYKPPAAPKPIDTEQVPVQKKDSI